MELMLREDVEKLGRRVLLPDVALVEAAYARAAGNASTQEVTASAAQLVGPVCTAATLEATAAAGSAVSLSASATCAAGAAPEYRFLAKAPGDASYRELRPYGAGATFAWDTAGLAAGRWDVLVYARAAGHGSLYEAWATRSQARALA